MSAELIDTKTLPENAYKPLHDGELYLPSFPLPVNCQNSLRVQSSGASCFA